MQNPQLESHLAELTAIRAEAAALFAALDSSALNRRPGGGDWSVAQQIDHLLKAGAPYPALFQREIAALQAANKRATGPFSYSFLERQIIAWMKPTGYRKSLRMPVPLAFAPPDTITDTTALAADFDNLQSALLDILRSADGLDLRAATIASPINDRVRMSLNAWFAAILAHERYHLNSAKALTASERRTDAST